MYRNAILALLWTILNSCADKPTSTEKNIPIDRETVYLRNDVDCGWKNTVELDTVYFENYRFKIISKCQDRISFIDTVFNSNDTAVIRNWFDTEFIISSNLFSNSVTISKATYRDSLASDLLTNGFLTPPYDILFNQVDSTLIFKTFIGHADSDVGEVYVLRLDKNGKAYITAVEPSETETD